MCVGRDAGVSIQDQKNETKRLPRRSRQQQRHEVNRYRQAGSQAAYPGDVTPIMKSPRANQGSREMVMTVSRHAVALWPQSPHWFLKPHNLSVVSLDALASPGQLVRPVLFRNVQMPLLAPAWTVPFESDVAAGVKRHDT